MTIKKVFFNLDRLQKPWKKGKKSPVLLEDRGKGEKSIKKKEGKGEIAERRENAEKPE